MPNSDIKLRAVRASIAFVSHESWYFLILLIILIYSLRILKTLIIVGDYNHFIILYNYSNIDVEKFF